MKIKTVVEFASHAEAARWLVRYTIPHCSGDHRAIYNILASELPPGNDDMNGHTIAHAAVRCLAEYFGVRCYPEEK